MQLRIMSLEKTDFGRYHCKAKNNHGTDSDQAELIGKVKFHTCLTFFLRHISPKMLFPSPPPHPTIVSYWPKYVYTGYHGTKEIEPGLCTCTADNPLLKLRDYLSIQAHKPCPITQYNILHK